MPSLHWHPLLVCAFLLGTVSSWAQQLLPFGSDFAPSFSFEENYTESAEFSVDEADFVDTTSYSLDFTAKASMQGINPATFENDSLALNVFIGNLDLSLPFAEGTRSTVAGMKSIKWTLEGLDPDTFDDLPRAGTVELRYDDAKLTVTFSLLKAWDDYNIAAPDQAGFAEPLNFPLLLDFSVGPYGFSGRTTYVRGTAELYNLVVSHGGVQMTFTDLAKVHLTGEIDSLAPSVLITNPIPGQDVTTGTINVSGIAGDDHAVQSVFLKVNNGNFTQVTLNANGTWSIGDVVLVPGDNTLVARAVDADGNTSADGVSTVHYTSITSLTVNAAGDGSGRVLADYFPPIEYVPGQPSPSRITQQELGKTLVFVATAGPDAVFDGWTSNYALTALQATSATLTVEMQVDMTLTAHFLRNPFTPVRGRYSGLIESNDPTDRGALMGKLMPTGGFSLVAKIGHLTIPVKGQFSNSGEYAAVLVVEDTVYVVNLALNVSGIGQRQITGTIKGGTVDATITADLSTYSKASNPVSPLLTGTYNVLIPPSEGNSDTRYPVGIGFGRLTVRFSGSTTLVGRLGDGSSIAASAPIAGESAQNENFWPLFSSLYGERGSISGRLTFDINDPAHDVSGALEWYRPPASNPRKPYAAGFSGQSDLAGAKFLVTAAGQLPLLQGTNGVGQAIVMAPGVALLPPLNVVAPCSVLTDGTITIRPVAGLSRSTLVLDSTTGLFSGDIFERNKPRHAMGIVVKRKLNRAGGFFSRARVTGSAEITP